MSEHAWYYCLTHHAVEGEDACPNIERLGPYASQEEAAAAPTRVAERSAAWDAEDAEDD